MRSLFRFFAERHLLATLLTLMVLLFGINGMLSINKDLYPKVKINQVSIGTVYPGASAEDVELSVTNKIEKQVQSITGIEKYVSISMENFSQIIVKISPDLSEKRVEEVVQEIRNAISRVKNLPKEVSDAPSVERIRTSQIPIIEIGLSAKDVPYRELREQARILEKKLKSVPGVSKLDRTGYRAREVKIELSPKALNACEIPMQEIIHAIQARNIRGTGGTLESYVGEKDILTLSQFRKPAQVGEVIVRSSFEGPAIKVKDLAIIQDGFEDSKTISRINGKTTIAFTVYKAENADIMRTVAQLKALLQEEQQHLPDGIEVLYSNDISRYVEASYDVVMKNGVAGFVLVIIMLTLFLNLRTGFWVALGIPVTVLGAIALLPFFGVSLDVITLSAMILVLGIIVDDAIIISENINRHRELGESPIDAAVNGLSEVFQPVLTTVLTTLLAFAPMFFIPGEEGKFIFVIPLVITLTLLISLFEGIFALPAHIAHGKLSPPEKQKASTAWFDFLRKKYETLMHSVLSFRYVLFTLFLVALSVSLWYATTKMKIETFPNTGAEEFSVYANLAEGASLTETSEKVKEIEALLEEFSKGEIESYSTHIGLDGDGLFKKNAAVLNIILTPFSTRQRTAETIAQEFREKYAPLEGFERISVDIEESGPSAKTPVLLHLIGSNDSLRAKIAHDITTFMDSLGTLQDIKRNDLSGKEQIELKLNYEKLARLGLTVADIAQNVRIAFDGETVTRVRYGEENVQFRVILDKESRQNIKYLKSLSIPNNTNRLIPLNRVAKFHTAQGAADYRHYNGERVTTITAELIPNQTTPEEATEKILARFDIAGDYPGMSLLSRGAAEKTQTTVSNSLRTFAIAIIGIYFLLMILFNSVTQPLLVLLSVPFGFIGIVLVFGLHDEPFSFMGMLGIIGYSGVVVNDSLVLVDHLNSLIKKYPNAALKELIAQGTANRLRAVLLTTITTAAGLLPLAYGIGGADPYNAPMALALGWGLIFATPLILMLVPCMYMIRSDLNKLFAKKSTGTPENG